MEELEEGEEEEEEEELPSSFKHILWRQDVWKGGEEQDKDRYTDRQM